MGYVWVLWGYLSEEWGGVCSSFVFFVCIVAFWSGVNLGMTGDFRLGEVKVTLCFWYLREEEGCGEGIGECLGVGGTV